MDSIFTKIINGDIPSYKVAEDEHFFAFLDINPNAKGHTLCIPKKQIDRLFDMDETHYLELMRFSRKVALAMEKTLPCERVGMAVVGLEVPHVHVHLIPIQSMQDMNFIKKETLTAEEFTEVAAAIQKNMQ